EIAQQNLRVLAEAVREGCTVVCSEPTAALMLTHDYLDLMDDPDAKLVAERTVELTAFLWGLHQEGRLRTDFRRLEVAVGHHVPLAEGGRRRQADAAPGAVPGPGVRAVAGRGPQAARADPGAGAAMTYDVYLFARAKDLAGAEMVRVELSEGATVADLRARLA